MRERIKGGEFNANGKEKEVNGQKKVALNEKDGRKDLQIERQPDTKRIDRQENEKTIPETGRQTGRKKNRVRMEANRIARINRQNRQTKQIEQTDRIDRTEKQTDRTNRTEITDRQDKQIRQNRQNRRNK